MLDRGPDAVGRSPAATHRGGEDDDSWLVQRCRAGEEAAFDLIVHRYEPMLLRHCALIVGGAAAQDAVQDALLSAWNAIRAGAEIRALRPWLYTIAHRRAIAMRHDERHPEVLELADTVAGGRSPADEASQAARLRETFTALAGLPDAQRAALIGSAVHGQSGSQIARQLGISECTARQLVFRARTRLRSGAACLVPPAIAVRLMRRVAPSPARLATLARRGAAAGQTEATGRLLRVAATAVAGITLAGSAAFHLIAQPSTRGRGTHALIRGRHEPRPALPGALPPTVTMARHGIDRGGIALRTAAADSPNAHVRSTGATTTKHARAVNSAVEPAVAGQRGGPPGAAIPADGVRGPARAPARAAIAPADASAADAGPAVGTPAVTTTTVTTPGITVPSVSLPAVTTPSITVASVSLPAVTTPAVSLPAVSTPAVTLPAVTLPAVTTPPVSLPGASSAGTPAATLPVVTVPGISVPAIPALR